MRVRDLIIAAVTLAILTTGVWGGDKDVERRLESDLRFLADDLLEGRGTPSRGLDIAALYLSNRLRALGWEPGNGDSYLQTFPVKYFSPSEATYKISLAGVELKPDEYYFLPFGLDPARTPVSFKLVFAGHGIYDPEKGIDDYGDLDMRGKAAVALYGAPWEPDPGAPHSYDRVVGKSVGPIVRGGEMFIYVSPEFEDVQKNASSMEVAFATEMVNSIYTLLPGFPGQPMGMGPVLIITPTVFDRLLKQASGRDYAGWQEEFGASDFKAFNMEASIDVTIDAKAEQALTSNVAAILRGTDPELSKEWLVLTAHYDHLGFRSAAEGEDGIWNGADDNASGTAAFLEVARQLKEGPPPKRSLMIVYFAGEDRGLLGSAYYSENPLVPHSQVVANINVDMVGRSQGAVTGYAPVSEAIFRKAVALSQDREIKVVADANPGWRIAYFLDSYHFARFGVPFIEFFTELHADYHQVSDEVDKIDIPRMAEIVATVTAMVRAYGDGEEKPDFVKPVWFKVP